MAVLRLKHTEKTIYIHMSAVAYLYDKCYEALDKYFNEFNDLFTLKTSIVYLKF